MTTTAVGIDVSNIRFNVRFDSDGKADLPALIREFYAEYLAVDMKGYQPWERPSVFLHECIAELLDSDFAADNGTTIRQSGFGYDPEIDFHWTSGHWDALLTVCPQADPDYEPDPWVLARKPGPLDVPLPLSGAS